MTFFRDGSLEPPKNPSSPQLPPPPAGPAWWLQMANKGCSQQACPYIDLLGAEGRMS